MTMNHGSMMSSEMQECISVCLNTHRLSVEMIAHCLSMGGAHATPEHIGLLQDNAQITLTSADFMLRGSPLHARTCAVCAEVNTRAAQDSEQIGADSMMQTFIAQCRECAQSCQRMAQMMGYVISKLFLGQHVRDPHATAALTCTPIRASLARRFVGPSVKRASSPM